MIVYCTTIYVIKKGTSHTHTQKHKALVATQTHSRLRSKLAGRFVSSGVTWRPGDWMCWGGFSLSVLESEPVAADDSP